MDKFKPSSSLFRVVHCKEFAPFKKYIIAPRGFRIVMQVYQIKHLKWFFPIDQDVTAHSLSVMYERCHNGERIYHHFEKDVGMYSFIIGNNRPFVLVLPGGGYGDVCSIVEGFPIAVRLNELGYNAFVGQYSVGKEAKYPKPQKDVSSFLNYIIEHASELNIDTNNYGILGCSAGGHLAASWGTKVHGYEKYGLPKPGIVMLAYPVITMGPYTHKGTKKNLIDDNKELEGLLSIEKQVDKDFPKIYIWQCDHDKVVPYQNTLLMVETLNKHNVKYEHLLVSGNAHGWGLAKDTAADGWLENALQLWNKY